MHERPLRGSCHRPSASRASAGSSVTTAHLLLVLCERTAVAGLLREHGVTEATLLDGGGGAIEEHGNVLGFALARAEQIAGALHSREVNAAAPAVRAGARCRARARTCGWRSSGCDPAPCSRPCARA